MLPHKRRDISPATIRELIQPVEFCIIRHGATMYNGEAGVSVDLERGWSNIGLTPEGEEEARRAADELKGKGISAIVSSDLRRARETAEIIGDLLGIAPQFSFELRPWGLGIFTDKPTKPALPAIREYACNKPDMAVPEGESFHTFTARAFDGLYKAVSEHRNQKIAIILHLRVERLLESWDKEGQPWDHTIDIDTFLEQGDPPGGVETFITMEAALKGKLTHQEAGYRYAGPGRDRCEYCKSFKGVNNCKKVLPPISPDGWCKVGHSAIDGHAFF